MAVSNAIGSNVFDILMCLGLPWFIDTAIVHPGSVVRVRSKGISEQYFWLRTNSDSNKQSDMNLMDDYYLFQVYCIRPLVSFQRLCF